MDTSVLKETFLNLQFNCASSVANTKIETKMGRPRLSKEEKARREALKRTSLSDHAFRLEVIGKLVIAPNWGKEIRLFKKVLIDFPNQKFWLNLELKYKLPSFAVILKNNQEIRKYYDLFCFQFIAPKMYQTKEVGPIAEKPRKLRSFLPIKEEEIEEDKRKYGEEI